MSDVQAPVSQLIAGPPAAPKPGRNTIGMVALGLSIFGTLLAFIPPTNGFSWLVLFAGFILAIIGLTRKGQGKATSIVALVLSFVFWIVSIFLGIAFAVAAANVTDNSTVSNSNTEQEGEGTAEAPASEEDSGAPTIGETVTTPKGVDVTVTGVAYGVTTPNEFVIDGVKGSLASVSMTMLNGDIELVSLSTSSVVAYVGDIEYEASAVFGPAGDWFVYEDVNPGLGTDFSAYFDLPAGAEITSVTFKTAIVFGEEVTIATK